MIMILFKKEKMKNRYYLLIFLLTISFILICLIVNEEHNQLKKDISQDVKISFSKKSGFYNQKFDVEIFSSDSNSKIYYTLNGEPPNKSSKIYENPIHIKQSKNRNFSNIPSAQNWKPPIGKFESAIIVWAVVINNENEIVAEKIGTYFIGKDTKALPIISLVVEPKSFFGFKSGIYIRGKDFYKKKKFLQQNSDLLNVDISKLPANYKDRTKKRYSFGLFTYFDLDTTQIESYVKVQIHGNFSRGFSQKSLKLNFVKPNFEKKTLKYNFFLNNKTETTNKIILRNAGNDWNKSFLRDVLCHSVIKEKYPNLDIQDSQPSIVFINGNYWGIHHIREIQERFYLKNKYSIEKDLVFLFPNDTSECDSNLLYHLHNYPLIDTNFIDFDSFFDYIIIQLFTGNTDFSGNIKFYFNPFDEKWRWMIYDFDLAFTEPHVNLYEHMEKLIIGQVFKSHINHPKIKQKFLERLEYFFKNNVAEAFTEKLMFLEKQLQPEMETHIRRWRSHNSIDQWVNEVELLYENITIREKNFKEQIKHVL